MKVPMTWLREYCDPPADTGGIVRFLDLTGTEVERVSRHGVAPPERFVVGRVLAADPHPEADRLTVCRVDLGEPGEVQIVCGAPNVAAGQTVAVARPGARMPDGTELGTARLRGVESHGMILAEDELAIGTDHDGILVLDDGPAPGTRLDELFTIETEVIELEITPNRPDCLGVYGVAREVSASTGAPLSAPPWADDPGGNGEVPGFEVVVECPDLCPRFTARLFDGVEVGPSPPWLKARLAAAGQRPINNVVDITNYVMLLTGQPLHAFDADRVAGGRLVVRRGRPGDRLTTLDGEERVLDEEMVVICDDEGPTSLAAVMGGERSEVGPGTDRVLMEVATWDGPNVQRTSTRLGLRSEASARFEKQLQPEQAMEAQAVATKLMAEVCGARHVGGTIDVGGPGPDPEPILLADERVRKVLGIDVPGERSAPALRALEFEVAEIDEGLRVVPPARRRDDVAREVDVIEEVARLCALEDLPPTLPRISRAGGLDPAQRLRRRAEDALVGRGLREISGWSFAAPDLPSRLGLPEGDRRSSPIRLANPMSSEESTLRTSLLGSLLDVARRNLGRGIEAVRLFEVGAVYLPAVEDELPHEPQMIAALVVGPVRPASWREPDPPASDAHHARALAEAVVGALGLEAAVGESAEPCCHPARQSGVEVAGGRVGWFGELHPLVCERWDLPGATAFELDLSALLAEAAGAGPRAFAPYSTFPPVREDLAVVVDEEIPAERVLEAVRGAAGPDLVRAELFDVYRGEQVGEGRVSLAVRLELRAPDRTLTDEEVRPIRERIVDALEAMGGRLRD